MNCCKNNTENGRGTLTLPNGHKYVGNWYNGHRHGLGAYTINKGKYLRTAGNKEGYKLAKEVQNCNKLSGKQKFVGLFVGGGAAGGVVYDAENIGTFGDIFFDEGELTALDRDKKRTAKDDAMRMLYNKLKFAGEMGFPIIQDVVGDG